MMTETTVILAFTVVYMCDILNWAMLCMQIPKKEMATITHFQHNIPAVLSVKTTVI